MPSTLDLSFVRSAAALRRIGVIAVACTVAGGLYGFLSPKWYRSVVAVVPARPQRGLGISSVLGSEFAGVAAGLDASIGAGAADVARIGAVLQSTAVSDAVIEKFDLRTRYREKYQETAREA